MDVQRLCCSLLPGVAILGIGSGSSRVHLAHLQTFVGLLKGGGGRDSVRRALNVFFNSEVGKVIKEHHGGDLMSAIGKGPLQKMIYSYRGKPSGSPSQFVTVEGIKEIIRAFPNADEEVRSRLKNVFEEDAMSFLSCEQATPEQCDKEDAVEEVEEIFDTGYDHSSEDAVGQGPHHSVTISFKTICELRNAYVQSETEKKYLKDSLRLEKGLREFYEVKKDVVLAKVDAEKEKALLENQHLKEKAVADAEKEDLKKQLAIMQEREQARKEREQAVMEERERTMREARAKDELEKKLAMMEERERARAKESETAAQLNAKEKELEWMKLQLEMEQRRKTMRPHVDVEDAGAPSDTSAPLQVR